MNIEEIIDALETEKRCLNQAIAVLREGRLNLQLVNVLRSSWRSPLDMDTLGLALKVPACDAGASPRRIRFPPERGASQKGRHTPEQSLYKTLYYLRGWLPEDRGSVPIPRVHRAIREDDPMPWLTVRPIVRLRGRGFFFEAGVRTSRSLTISDRLSLITRRR